MPTLFKIWLNGSLIQNQKWGKSYYDNNKNSDDNDRQQTISIRQTSDKMKMKYTACSYFNPLPPKNKMKKKPEWCMLNKERNY